MEAAASKRLFALNWAAAGERVNGGIHLMPFFLLLVAEVTIMIMVVWWSNLVVKALHFVDTHYFMLRRSVRFVVLLTY